MATSESSNVPTLERLSLDRPALPVLHDVDVVVVGGSFGGVAAALSLARRGRRVVLVEPRTYLGREVTATLRPWIPATGPPETLPEVVSACIGAGADGWNTTLPFKSRPDPGEYPLHLDTVKVQLEDLLLRIGVQILYASLPAGVCIDGRDGGGRIEGVYVGNKSGRQLLRCRTLVDATATALVARLAGATFRPAHETPVRYTRTLEFDGVTAPDAPDLTVPSRLGIVDDSIRFHPGYRNGKHWLVECGLLLPGHCETAFELSRRENEARTRTMELVAYLETEVPIFRDAYLAAASHELHGPYATAMAGEPPSWVEGMAEETLTWEEGERLQRVPATAFAGPIQGLWCLNGAVRTAHSPFSDPVVASGLGRDLGRYLAGNEHGYRTAPARGNGGESVASQTPPVPVQTAASSLSVREIDRPQRGRHYRMAQVRAAEVPVVRSADALVVGGGTSGATAAITAGREGLHTVLVEMNPGLGGTGTYGGVHSYWFGRRVGFAAEVTAAVEAMHNRLNHRPPKGPIPKWNIEAKAFALLEAAVDSGVEILFNAIVIGTVVERAREGAVTVRGVVVATRSGPMAILGDVVIDATGDGDVAATAGAGYVYGAARDHVAMWYSLAQFAKPGLTRNNFTSMVDVSNVEDYTRAILAGRRRGGRADTHDHGIYVAPRESRHIKGEVVLTLTDQLRQRRWPDVVNVAFSNNDIKGHSSSDWIRMGLISPNLEIEIPYRALLPEGLEQILVVGKAISATHDALPAIRMQADMENLGGVAALAAAQAVRRSSTVREIDLDELQKALVARNVLPETVIGRELVPQRFGEEALRRKIAALDAEQPLYAYQDMEINEIYTGRIPIVDVCCAGPDVVPLLEEALAAAEGARRLRLAQAVAMTGSQAAVPVLVSALSELFSGERLPRQAASIRHVQDPPDQGSMPDAAYLLYSLGMVPDCRALSIWARVAALLEETPADAVRDRRSGIFYYVDAVCAGAERLGNPAAVSTLRRLHRYPPLRNKTVRRGFQPDYFEERQAYLELVIGRALARCGSPDGLLVLIRYLDDARALLAEHAHSELVAISGEDRGKETAAWSQWLETAGEDLPPMPWQQPSDAVLSWRETVLTEKDAETDSTVAIPSSSQE